jgi:hypothetical protein
MKREKRQNKPTFLPVFAGTCVDENFQSPQFALFPINYKP